jgi:signal transduction histidine kinase
VTDEQRECLARIQRSERHLLDLITEILDYARIEAGRITYESSVVSVRPLLEDVVSWMERHAHAKGIRLCSALGDVAVCGDVKRVRQIIVNLLSNAL